MTFKHIANTVIPRDQLGASRIEIKIVDNLDPLEAVCDGYFIRGDVDAANAKVPFIVIERNHDEQELLRAVESLGKTTVDDFTHVEFTNGLHQAENDREQRMLKDAQQMLEPVFEKMFEKAAALLAKIPLKVQLHQGQGDILENFFVNIQDRMSNLQRNFDDQIRRAGAEIGELRDYIRAKEADDLEATMRNRGEYFARDGFRTGFGRWSGANQLQGRRYGDSMSVPGQQHGGYYSPDQLAERRLHRSENLAREIPPPRRVGDPVSVQQEADNGGRVMSSGRFPTSAPGLHERTGSVSSMLKGLKEAKQGLGSGPTYAPEQLDNIFNAVYQFSGLSSEERDLEINDLIGSTVNTTIRLWFDALSEEQKQAVMVMIESQLVRLDVKSKQLAEDLMASSTGEDEIVNQLREHSINSIKAIADIATAAITGFHGLHA